MSSIPTFYESFHIPEGFRCVIAPSSEGLSTVLKVVDYYNVGGHILLRGDLEVFPRNFLGGESILTLMDDPDTVTDWLIELDHVGIKMLFDRPDDFAVVAFPESEISVVLSFLDTEHLHTMALHELKIMRGYSRDPSLVMKFEDFMRVSLK